MFRAVGLLMLVLPVTMVCAQTNGVEEKRPLYRYVSYWTFPPGHWRDVFNEHATANQKILAPALADGTLVGYGDEENLMHSVDGYTHDQWWQANSWAGVMKVSDGFHNSDVSSSPLFASSSKHWDQVFLSRFYNWKPGSWKGAYRYTATYELQPQTDADEALRTLSSFDVPLFEKLLADGTIVEYELDRELRQKTDAPVKFIYVVVVPSAEALDKMTAAVRAAVGASSLLGPAFASMTVNQTAQVDISQVDVTHR